MKIHAIASLVVAIILLNGCGTPGSGDNKGNTDTTTVADTGYTGIKQFMSGQYKVSEVEFRNGVREGLTKTFYMSGKLQRTFWYRNGLRQDSSSWFYEEGQLFRTTPYVNDTVHGIQRQYYRTGQIKAELEYKNGYRTLYFKEYDRNGKTVTGYPQIKFSSKDTYSQNGQFRIILELTNPKTDVRFYKGDLVNDTYDTTRVKKIRMEGFKGYLDLKKTGSPKGSSVGVFAEVLTGFGNRLLLYKKIELPYNDLE